MAKKKISKDVLETAEKLYLEDFISVADIYPKLMEKHGIDLPEAWAAVDAVRAEHGLRECDLRPGSRAAEAYEEPDPSDSLAEENEEE